MPNRLHRHLRWQHQKNLGQEARGHSTSHVEMKHCQCKLGQNLCRKDHSGSRRVEGRLRGCEARRERCVTQGSKGCWPLLPGPPGLFPRCLSKASWPSFSFSSVSHSIDLQWIPFGLASAIVCLYCLRQTNKQTNNMSGYNT